MKVKSIGIDVRWMIGDYRGMGRYAHHLISSVKEHVLGFAPVDVKHASIDTKSEGHSFFPLWEQKTLRSLCCNNNIQILVCPYNTGPIVKPKNTKLVVVVHDLIFMRSWSELPRSTSLYQTLGRIYRRFIVPRVIRTADVILTVSKYTEEELLSNYSVDAPLFVVPNSIDNDWLKLSILPLEKRSNYLLTVAGEAPSKNLFRLISAFSRSVAAKELGAKLKIVGVKRSSHAIFQKHAARCGVDSQVEFVGFVPEAELMALYQNCRGMVFASLFEGFGIPLIEAMAAGAPIACSNTTSIPEVVGDCAIQFDPYLEEEITSSIEQLLVSNHQLLESLIYKAKKRVHKFSIDEVQKQFSEVWGKIYES